jgi:ASC-1-like (ASCH) protein
VWKFDNLGDDKEHIYTKVYEIKVYSSFEEAIGDTDISLLLPSLGKNINSFEKAVNVYHSFPGYFENSKKYGVVRFKLQRIYYIDI